jgi:large subunit ribosomal protein L13
MKTQVAKKDEIKRDWFVVDAEGKVLGRVATTIANILRGKHKPTYSPSVDTGDFVIVLNAGKIELTGTKLDKKVYYRHSGFPGGIKSTTAGQLMAKKPEEVIKKAVKGMLPKNKLARHMLKKLKIYTAGEHPHEAQQPRNLSL